MIFCLIVSDYSLLLSLIYSVFKMLVIIFVGIIAKAACAVLQNTLKCYTFES